MAVRIKVCGITNLDDALAAADLGAWALGFIMYDGSPRHITPEKARAIVAALPPFVTRVGVFVNEEPARIAQIAATCGFDRVQIVTDTPSRYDGLDPASTIMVVRIATVGDIEQANGQRFFPLLDTHRSGSYGGTGSVFDWRLLSLMRRPYILAGGITPGNVSMAASLRPYAVDTSSGVEAEPGRKDHDKLRELFARIREVDDV